MVETPSGGRPLRAEAMIHGLYRTAHGRCCLCGDERPLYTIRITAKDEQGRGPEVEVVAKRPDVHSGACAPCLERLGRTISYQGTKLAFEEDHGGPENAHKALVLNASEREPEFLTRGPYPQGAE